MSDTPTPKVTAVPTEAHNKLAHEIDGIYCDRTRTSDRACVPYMIAELFAAELATRTQTEAALRERVRVLIDALKNADEGIANGQAVRSQTDFTRWMRDVQALRPNAALFESTPEIIASELAELRAAVQPIVDAVDVNDSDTLAMQSSDSEVIWTARGSWSRPASITLGHLRTIRAVRKGLAS